MRNKSHHDLLVSLRINKKKKKIPPIGNPRHRNVCQMNKYREKPQINKQKPILKRKENNTYSANAQCATTHVTLNI